MTIKELIEKLRHYPEESEVRYFGAEGEETVDAIVTYLQKPDVIFLQ